MQERQKTLQQKIVKSFYFLMWITPWKKWKTSVLYSIIALYVASYSLYKMFLCHSGTKVYSIYSITSWITYAGFQIQSCIYIDPELQS